MVGDKLLNAEDAGVAKGISASSALKSFE